MITTTVHTRVAPLPLFFTLEELANFLRISAAQLRMQIAFPWETEKIAEIKKQHAVVYFKTRISMNKYMFYTPDVLNQMGIETPEINPFMTTHFHFPGGIQFPLFGMDDEADDQEDQEKRK